MLPKLGVALMLKNESRIIERCLNSILQIADHVIITDTGSTDDTVTKAGLFLQNHKITYNIYFEPFKGFGWNRERLLEICRLNHPSLDYILIVDADDLVREELSFHPTKFKENLTLDFYYIKHAYGFNFHHFQKLTKNNLIFNYVGLTHEYIDTKDYKGGYNSDIYFEQLNDGYRRYSGNKFTHDIELLEQEPDKNSRIRFYLGESYRSVGDYEKALENYKLRTKMGGWNEEIFYSYYQMGKIHEILKSDKDLIFICYWKAYLSCPHRLESLFALREHHLKYNETEYVNFVTKKMKEIKRPDSGLFIEVDKYVISESL